MGGGRVKVAVSSQETVHPEFLMHPRNWKFQESHENHYSIKLQAQQVVCQAFQQGPCLY